MNTRSLTASALLASAVIASSTLVALGQPTNAGGGPGGGQPGTGAVQPQQPLDAKGTRELIVRLLDEHRQGISRLDEALKKLDGGADPATVKKEFLDSFRMDRRTNQGGGNRPDRGPQGGSEDASRQRPSGGGAGGGRNSEYELTGPRLSAEDHAKVLELLDQKHPELLRKIRALGAENKEMTERLIDGVGGRVRWYETVLREKEPEEFTLRIKEIGTGLDIMKLGREITDAKAKGDTSAETVIRARLRTVMSERFDTRQQLNRDKIKQLREQADLIEKTLAENDKKRDEVIDRRTDEFLKLMDGKGKKGEKTEADAPPPATRKP